MAPRPDALLVAPSGPTRRGARQALEAAGLTVRTAAEPFEATALFAGRPATLVVLSLDGFHVRDLPFLRTVRRLAPACRILLLVPEGRRPTAVRALAAGADLWLPEPHHPEELTAFARCLVQPVATDAAAAGQDRAALRALAAEVSHAVNNPLQILSLIGEEGRMDAGALDAEVQRVRNVVRILDRFGRIGEAPREPADLGIILRQALEEAGRTGLTRSSGRPPRDGPILALVADDVRHAIASLLDVLAAHGAAKPVTVRAGVHALAAAHRDAIPGTPGDARLIEVAVQARDVHLDDTTIRGLEHQVIWNHEETRESHPGLALPRAVAGHHGGALLCRSATQGTVFGLVVADGAAA